MILKKLSIYGFKSFADKTELDFGSGMTAVIGPNGCGKSNVVDAIRWVFGEQKASMLRSANMQEVIFSGTQKRQPLNMAEVTLTIENSRGVLPVEYSELAITRRIYRSGESEYRLNKVPCRLRDIQNIFLDTGVGSTAYTTIENKMIEKILSDRAEERRTLFEEAAGIGKYKQMRKESISKLEKTRQDLLRINDKVSEADRQVRMLARHVEKAKKYKTYFDALKDLETSFENRNYRTLSKTIVERGELLKELSQTRENDRAKAAAEESRMDTMRLDALETEKELEGASRSAAESSEVIVRIDREASVAAERLNNLNQTIARLDEEAAALEKSAQEAAEFKSQIEKSAIERETELEKCRERLAGANAELAKFDEGLTGAREDADALSHKQIELVNQTADVKNKLNAASSALAGALEKKERNDREIQSLDVRYEEFGEAIELCKQQLIGAEESNKNLAQTRAALIERIEKEETRYRGLLEKEKHYEAQIAGNKSQLKFLEGLDASFTGYEAGVKSLLTANLPGLRGIVANLISITDESLLQCVEKIAGDTVQTVVFDTDAQLANAVKFLKENNEAGAAKIISLERLKTFRQRQLVSDRQPPQELTPVSSIIKTAEGCETIASQIFGKFFVAQNHDSAINSARNIETGAAVISKDGGVICYGDGLVAAGSAVKETAGLLQRKQQIVELAKQIENYEQEHNAILGEKDMCVITRDEAKVALVEVDEKISKGRHFEHEQQTTIRLSESEMNNIAKRVQTLSAEQDDLDATIKTTSERLKETESEVADLSAKREALDAELENARLKVRSMEDERITLADHLKNIELEAHGLANRIANDRRDIERLSGEIAQFYERKQNKMEDKSRSTAEIADLENRCAELRAELDAAKATRAEREAARDAVRESYNAKLAGIEELRGEIKSIHNSLEEIANKIHDAELKQSLDEQERRRIRERMWEAYELDLESAAPESFAALDEDLDAVVREIAAYKDRIKHVGQVNMAALEDHEVENARLMELTAQRDDLQSAVNELERAISKLDKEARAQFLATFKEVQKNFTDMFTTLFEGGEASITLAEDVDPLEAEIQINVRPAGKKMRGVALLSGGERALTAISLLFALYLVKPSAYCILDELDAPLDDANISRFVKVLKRFAEKTQFIIITHNKRTMEAADLLYGVTQQESGVSTIVSVKFEEAELRAA